MTTTDWLPPTLPTPPEPRRRRRWPIAVAATIGGAAAFTAIGVAFAPSTPDNGEVAIESTTSTSDAPVERVAAPVERDAEQEYVDWFIETQADDFQSAITYMDCSSQAVALNDIPKVVECSRLAGERFGDLADAIAGFDPHTELADITASTMRICSMAYESAADAIQSGNNLDLQLAIDAVDSCSTSMSDTVDYMDAN